MSNLPDRRMIATPHLRRTIREQGRLESWVGRQVNLSKGHFSLVLAGRRTISEWQARLLAALLGVDFYLLFEVSYETTSVSTKEPIPA